MYLSSINLPHSQLLLGSETPSLSFSNNLSSFSINLSSQGGGNSSGQNGLNWVAEAETTTNKVLFYTLRPLPFFLYLFLSSPPPPLFISSSVIFFPFFSLFLPSSSHFFCSPSFLLSFWLILFYKLIEWKEKKSGEKERDLGEELLYFLLFLHYLEEKGRAESFLGSQKHLRSLERLLLSKGALFLLAGTSMDLFGKRRERQFRSDLWCEKQAVKIWTSPLNHKKRKKEEKTSLPAPKGNPSMLWLSSFFSFSSVRSFKKEVRHQIRSYY